MCVSKVLEVIEKGCKIENAMSEMKIHRAHRIGKFQIGKVRPIVAKFMYYPDRERVRLSADKLARPLGISQQFPQEVVETNKNSKIEITGYKHFQSYRKVQNKKAKRNSGGILLFVKNSISKGIRLVVKNSISKGIRLVKNDTDCIQWFKLDKYFFGMTKDIYLCSPYIAPEGSPIYDFYDFDIFDKVERHSTFSVSRWKGISYG